MNGALHGYDCVFGRNTKGYSPHPHLHFHFHAHGETNTHTYEYKGSTLPWPDRFTLYPLPKAYCSHTREESRNLANTKWYQTYFCFLPLTLPRNFRSSLLHPLLFRLKNGQKKPISVPLGVCMREKQGTLWYESGYASAEPMWHLQDQWRYSRKKGNRPKFVFNRKIVFESKILSVTSWKYVLTTQLMPMTRPRFRAGPEVVYGRNDCL